MGTLTVFAFAALIVFVRTAFFDILDVQGDRLVGKETIPILLGEVRTQKLLRAGLALSFLILLMATALGWVRPLGYLMLLCPVFLGIVMAVHGRGRIHPGVRLEFLVESHFILAGLLALVWTVVAG